MAEKAANGVFFCEVCTARYAGAGDCAACDGEPLLDLRNADVVEMIRSFDEQRWKKRLGQFTGLAAVIVIPTVVVFNLLMGAATGKVLGLIPNMVLAGFGVSAFSGGLIAVMPPKKRLPAMLP
ncbi:MAG: hypothetical protein KC912_25485 [Proteobacteria bacterium]|nr:hypothetical protein [Pseudomonadota bacterium]